MGQSPVILRRRQDAVVRVKGVVLRAPELLGHGIAQQQGDDVVRLLVVLGLVKGEQDERPLVKGLVGKQGLQELMRPLGCRLERCVVAVVHHVGRHKHKLRHSLCHKVVVEFVKGLQTEQTRSVVRDAVKRHKGTGKDNDGLVFGVMVT